PHSSDLPNHDPFEKTLARVTKFDPNRIEQAGNESVRSSRQERRQFISKLCNFLLCHTKQMPALALELEVDMNEGLKSDFLDSLDQAFDCRSLALNTHRISIEKRYVHSPPTTATRLFDPKCQIRQFSF